MPHAPSFRTLTIPARVCLAATLVSALAMILAEPAVAQGPAYDATPRLERLRAYQLPPGYGPRDARRFGRSPLGYDAPASIRAYLPRNHAVPMYNEPPPR